MRIETIELAHIGRFREKKTVGPFDGGLNILAEPNEAGKSTLIKGLTRAFFDRYNAAHEDIRALRPAGTALCPQVTVVFAINGERYKLEKCFLDKKSSQLFRCDEGEWKSIAESQHADNRVRELLGAPQLEGIVKVKPEHWGLLQFLWARQGDPASWPEWHGADGERARGMLAAVELDPVARKISESLRAQYVELFTPKNGKVRANSALECIEQRLVGLEKQLSDVRAKRSEIESLEERHVALKRELDVLKQQRESAVQIAEALKAQAEQAERLTAKLSTLEAELKNASDALARVTADQESVKNAAKAIEQAEAGVMTAQAKLDRAAAELPAIEREMENTQSGLGRAAREREQAQARMNRIHALIQHRQLVDNFGALQATQRRVAALAAEAGKLADEKAKLPAVTGQQLKKWRQLDSELRELRAKAEASGLTVSLCAKRAGSLKMETLRGTHEVQLSPNAPKTVRAPQSLTLHLPGWGTVRITSGSTEAQELETQLREREERLAAALAEAGLTGLDDAEAALGQLAQIAQQIEKTRATLHAHLGEKFQTAAELDAEVARRERKLSSQHESLALSAEEQALSLTALEAEAEHTAAAVQRAAETEKCLRGLLAEQTAARDARRTARDDGQAELARLHAARGVHADQRARILERYSGNLASAFETAQLDFVKAEARCKEARRELPEDAQKLPERSRQAARTAAQIESEFQQKMELLRRIEAQLETRGGEGLYSRESALEEQIAEAQADATRLRRRAWAQRLVFELIERREQSATERVLRPLEDRLSAVFAELSGVRNRRVFFNEKLEITGIGARSDEAHPFSELSQGGKEQLLLALRAAIALEVAKTEPPLLVLDDVLVHTDPVRQQNVLEYLQSLAGQMQILVLTCHADRYRGAGKIITLNGGANGQ